jgi:hypothetical protein
MKLGIGAQCATNLQQAFLGHATDLSMPGSSRCGIGSGNRANGTPTRLRSPDV